MSKVIFKITSMLLITMLIGAATSGSSFAKIESPRKQLASGAAPEDIVCKSERILVIAGKTPFCLKSETAKMFEKKRGATVVSQESKVAIVPQSPSKAVPTKTHPKIENIPASGGVTVNFYITDHDLNTNHRGIDIINTAGLVEFTINGIQINGPDTMIETGPDTGRFVLRLILPDTVNNKPLAQDDIVVIRYFDQSDSSGENRTVTSSLSLSRMYAHMEKLGGQRIGRDFTVSIHEPDANLDSREIDKISLSKIEFRAKGGIRTTLANPAFDASSSYLLETGKNTGIFSVVIKMPRVIDGKVVHIKDWYELRYIDTSTPSGTSEKIILKGRIG